MPRAKRAPPSRTEGAPRKRSGGYATAAQRSTAQVLLRIPRELHAEYRAVADRDDISLQAWLLEAAAWHLRRSRVTPKPSADDLDAGNPFDIRATCSPEEARRRIDYAKRELAEMRRPKR